MTFEKLRSGSLFVRANLEFSPVFIKLSQPIFEQMPAGKFPRNAVILDNGFAVMLDETTPVVKISLNFLREKPYAIRPR